MSCNLIWNWCIHFFSVAFGYIETVDVMFQFPFQLMFRLWKLHRWRYRQTNDKCGNVMNVSENMLLSKMCDNCLNVQVQVDSHTGYLTNYISWHSHFDDAYIWVKKSVCFVFHKCDGHFIGLSDFNALIFSEIYGIRFRNVVRIWYENFIRARRFVSSIADSNSCVISMQRMI